VNICGYYFEGPYGNADQVQDRAGVYVILCPGGNSPTVIDVGESVTLKTRLQNHDRQGCWLRHCFTGYQIAVYYTAGKGPYDRGLIEHHIRKQYNPPCGER